jgi:hypothetical protein
MLTDKSRFAMLPERQQSFTPMQATSQQFMEKRNRRHLKLIKTDVQKILNQHCPTDGRDTHRATSCQVITRLMALKGINHGIVSPKTQVASHDAKRAYTATRRVVKLLTLPIEGQLVAAPPIDLTSFAPLHSEYLKATNEQTS